MYNHKLIVNSYFSQRGYIIIEPVRKDNHFIRVVVKDVVTLFQPV